MTDEEMDEFEKEIPRLAAEAFAAARRDALAAGLSVVASKDDILWEVFPNGERKFLKKLKPGVRVVPGTIIRI